MKKNSPPQKFIELRDPLGHLMSKIYLAETVTSLDSIARIQHGKKRKKYFLGAPGNCDLCSEWAIFEKYMIDGKVKDREMWVFMCEKCFKSRGVAIGWGFGQLFLREGQCKWLLVAGFQPKGGRVRST